MKLNFGILKSLQKYHEIQASDPARSKRFGIQVIILAILIVGISALVPLGLSMVNGDNAAGLILGGILLILGIGSVLLLTIRMIFCMVLQFKLNHGAFSVVALLFLLAGIGGAAAVIVLLL